MRLFRRWALATCVAVSSAFPALADQYPTRPLTIVVPYAPGGSADFTARLLAKQLSDDMKQNVIIENRAGGSGILGAAFVSDAKPDGYTLLYAGGPAQAIAAFTTPNMTLDLVGDITPITLVTSSPYVMLVNASVAATTPQALVALVKSNPNGFRWGVSGASGADFIGVEQFDLLAGIDPQIVPYNGGGPQLVAAVSGEVSGVLEPTSAAAPYIQSKQLRALGIASLTPDDTLPGVPTVASQGFPNYESSVWYGLWGPKNMPKDVVDEVYKLLAATMAEPALIKSMNATGTSVRPSASPDEFAAYYKAEFQRYGTLVRAIPHK